MYNYNVFRKLRHGIYKDSITIALEDMCYVHNIIQKLCMIGAIRCLLQRVSRLPVFPPPPLQSERGVDSHPPGHRVLHPDAAQLEGVGQGHKGSLEDTPRRHPGPDQT